MAPAPLDLATPIFGLIVDSLGPGEIMAVLVLLMVVVGPDRLPEVARKIGRGIAQARAQITSMSSEVREVVDDPAMQPLREIGEFAMRPRQKLSEIVRMAELDLTEEAAQIKALIRDDQPAGDASPDAAPASNELASNELASNELASPDAARSIADLPEPGGPPGDGPQYPATMDDKLGDRRVPVDSEVAAQRRRDAGGPADAAFTSRAAPLNAGRSEAPSEPATEQDGLPGTPSTPVASTAFTARGRPLGERVVVAAEAPQPGPTTTDDDPADDDPAAAADPADPAS